MYTREETMLDNFFNDFLGLLDLRMYYKSAVAKNMKSKES